jgi:hypothetical protein
MYVFIDEAGAFRQTPRPNHVSCVGALLVPESLVRPLFRRLRRLIRPWRVGGKELKGSQLNEAQVAAVLAALRRFDVLFMVVAIDMGRHSDLGIKSSKHEQVTKIRAAISDKMDLSVRARFERLANGIENLSDQLYVQSVALTKVVDAVIRHGTLYYVQRIPKTLGRFAWRLDAKDLTVTTYEKVWREVVGPYLQTGSLRQPLLNLNGADYSAFDRFQGELVRPPDHLRPHVTNPDEPFGYADIDAILSDLTFCQSHRSTGVQAVDMLVSTISRACNGHLQPAGWKGIGRLMPRPERGRTAVDLIALEDFPGADEPYADFVHAVDGETKRMVVS